MNDAAASFQEAVVEVLVAKTVAAARECNVKQILLSGGVAANRRLRERLPGNRRCRSSYRRRCCAPTTRLWWLPAAIFACNKAVMTALTWTSCQT